MGVDQRMKSRFCRLLEKVRERDTQGSTREGGKKDGIGYRKWERGRCRRTGAEKKIPTVQREFSVLLGAEGYTTRAQIAGITDTEMG